LQDTLLDLGYTVRDAATVRTFEEEEAGLRHEWQNLLVAVGYAAVAFGTVVLGKEARTGMEDEHRVDQAIRRGPEIEIIVDGRTVRAFEGESVAAALLAAGKRALRTTSRRGEPRGMYCGIGLCFDCVMTIDGQPNVRTCRTLVRAGMRVNSQSGDGAWRIEP